MKSKILIGLVSFTVLYALWIFFTTWADVGGNDIDMQYTADNERAKTLIVYNSDPMYNLDEQVCKAFAEGLKEKGISSNLVTNNNIAPYVYQYFDLYVFCANTYNFSPDSGIKKAVKRIQNIANKPTVAITLGAGSTKSSQKKFEYFLKCRDINVIDSRSFWLKRPNDSSRLDEDNVAVAKDKASQWAIEIAPKIK